jgi:diadenosine tetraphosphate (Ap4A) HIT family hydrolase
MWKLILSHYRWMPRGEWDALVRHDCPMCANVGQSKPVWHGVATGSSNTSKINTSGYCVLMYREHATELHQISPERQAAFMRDLLRAGGAVARVFQPIKMNYQLLGNAIPHLHWHIVPRYYGDPAPGRPLDAAGHIRRLNPDDYQRIIADLQMALKKTLQV